MQEEISIETSDGILLSANYFCPTSTFEHFVIIVPAIGVKKRYYEKFAKYLSEENIATYTFDYRGIGNSKPKSLLNFKATVSDWGEIDLESILQFALNKHPNKKVSIITHSGGGMLMGLAPSIKKADRIITVATPRGSVHDWKGSNFWKMALMVYILLPILPKLWGYFPGKKLKICENLPKYVAQEWGRWGQHPKAVLGHRTDKIEQYKKINSNLLALSFEDDFFAVKNSVDKINELYSNANVIRKHFTKEEVSKRGVGHFSFFKADFKKYYWSLAKDFIFEEKNVEL